MKQCKVGASMADDYFQHAAECPECSALAPQPEHLSTDECPTCTSERSQREAAERELAGIDSVLARRPALDKPTRRQNIEHAITTASTADTLRAERDSLTAARAIDDARLRAAEARVWPDGLTYGCDAADHLADEILGLRAERDALADALRFIERTRGA